MSNRKETTMNHARKFGWTLCAALGIAVSTSGIAEDQMQYAPQAGMSAESESAGAAAAPSTLTVVVTEPSLVFSDGQWYTFVDGVWYSFDGDGWQSLASADSGVSSDESAAASEDTMVDAYAYSDDDDGVWFVWVPVAYEDSQLGEYGANAMSPAFYTMDSASVDGIPVYSYETGQWYVLAPMPSDELNSSATYY